MVRTYRKQHLMPNDLLPLKTAPSFLHWWQGLYAPLSVIILCVVLPNAILKAKAITAPTLELPVHSSIPTEARKLVNDGS
jgi:hypothetical protein